MTVVAVSRHELFHALAAAQAVTLLYGSDRLKEFDVMFDSTRADGFFTLMHDDMELCAEPMHLCGLGPVVQKLETPEELAAAVRKSDGLETLTEAGNLSVADRQLARQVTNPVQQLRVLSAVQHLVNKRLGGPIGRGVTVLAKGLRDAQNQNLQCGDLSLADLVAPSAARGADIAGKAALEGLM